MYKLSVYLIIVFFIVFTRNTSAQFRGLPALTPNNIFSGDGFGGPGMGGPSIGGPQPVGGNGVGGTGLGGGNLFVIGRQTLRGRNAEQEIKVIPKTPLMNQFESSISSHKPSVDIIGGQGRGGTGLGGAIATDSSESVIGGNGKGGAGVGGPNKVVVIPSVRYDPRITVDGEDVEPLFKTEAPTSSNKGTDAIGGVGVAGPVDIAYVPVVDYSPEIHIKTPTEPEELKKVKTHIESAHEDLKAESLKIQSYKPEENIPKDLKLNLRQHTPSIHPIDSNNLKNFNSNNLKELDSEKLKDAMNTVHSYMFSAQGQRLINSALSFFH